MQTKAYKILKILKSKNIYVMYHEQTNTISFNTGGLTEPEINEIWSVKEDIVKLGDSMNVPYIYILKQTVAVIKEHTLWIIMVMIG